MSARRRGGGNLRPVPTPGKAGPKSAGGVAASGVEEGGEGEPERFQGSLMALRALLGHRVRAALDPAQAPDTDDLERLLAAPLPALPAKVTAQPERWVLLLALVPHLAPGFFEGVVAEHMPGGGDLPMFGGVKATAHRGMLPTGETAQFLLGGTDVTARLQVCRLFEPDQPLLRDGIVSLEPVASGEPWMSGRLVPSREWLDEVLLGRLTAPTFGPAFPARRVTTPMDWEDAVLHPQTRRQVDEIALWLAHHEQLLRDKKLGRMIKPGYRVLFHGPPGTGKTLTAALLGKRFEHEVYRVDLSQVVSKYIGETEKNLEGVFRWAERRRCILFFDEADALFGKRTSTQSAHDKYANQEVSYLLQRVEDFPGLLVLASNYKNNLDDAFLRRFHSVVHFPLPGTSDRLQLWQNCMPASFALDAAVDLPDLAQRYDLTGAGILSAVQFAALRALSRSDQTLSAQDLLAGIRREFAKEERTL